MQQVSNYMFESILSWSTKLEFVSNEYFLPRKPSARHENMSGSHKTMSRARSELYYETSWTLVSQGN